jgi:hypothetical protein
MMSSTRINSSVILVTNTPVVDWCRPKDNVTKASFEMERVCPDAVCRAHFVDGTLLGSPAVMTGLTIVTDAPVSTVTRHDLSPIHSFA